MMFEQPHNNPEPVRSPLCRWLIPAAEGVYTIRGRARFSEGRPLPAKTDAGTFPDQWDRWGDRNLEGELTRPAERTPEIPAAVLAWTPSEAPGVWSFEARFVGLSWRLREEAEKATLEALVFADGVRFDSSTWEAPSELEAALRLPGCDGLVFSKDDEPRRVLVMSEGEDELAATIDGFRRVFGEGFEMGANRPALERASGSWLKVSRTPGQSMDCNSGEGRNGS